MKRREPVISFISAKTNEAKFSFANMSRERMKFEIRKKELLRTIHTYTFQDEKRAII